MDYTDGQFHRDLFHILQPCGGRSISICSFLPDYPLVPFIVEPAQRIQRLQTRYDFVAALFWNVLLDQAAYSVEHQDLASRNIGFQSPKLVGLLATFLTNLHPSHLLIALSFDAADDRAVLPTALTRIGREMLGKAVPKLGRSWSGILPRMQNAFVVGATPNTIRAYVPHGDEYHRRPDWHAVATWNDRVRETLTEFSTALANERCN
jgi:hypothetical protein